MKSRRGPQLTSSDLTFESDLARDIFTNTIDNPIDLLDYCPRSRKHSAELDLRKKDASNNGWYLACIVKSSKLDNH